MCYGSIVIAYGLFTGTLVFNAASLWGAVAGVFAFTGRKLTGLVFELAALAALSQG